MFRVSSSGAGEGVSVRIPVVKSLVAGQRGGGLTDLGRPSAVVHRGGGGTAGGWGGWPFGAVDLRLVVGQSGQWGQPCGMTAH